MTKEAQEIFCDESGFTGNNLLYQQQPFFTYASIAISNEEAAECVAKLIKDFGIQGGELKGANLVKFSKGRKAVSAVLGMYHDRIKVTVYDKKYALACKFFEYIFEPTIATVNSMFYGIHFHRFISNVLHMHFKSEARYAEEIFADFQLFMRSFDAKSTNYLFSPYRLPEISPVLESIRDFSSTNRDLIVYELEHLGSSDLGKWILELSDSSLHSLLSHWGECHVELDVYCDSSKPLQEAPQIFDAMIGRKDRKYLEFDGKKRLLTYNLKDKVKFVDSKQFPGIQLADVAASAFGYMFQFPGEEISQKWGEYLKCVHEDSVLPDYDYIDLKKPEVIRNAIVLEELCARSREGKPLTDNFKEFLTAVTYRLQYDRPHF